jgi:7-cyano-7-deazaguanine synthase in queuosine biosynthesis
MKNIQYNDFTFDIYDGNLGAYVSGGADSALMLYILMSNIKQPLHIFSTANGKSNYREPINALKVINRVMDMTGFDPNNLRFHTHWTKHKTTDNVMLAEYMQTIKVDTLYFGFTRPPPNGAIVDFDTIDVAAQGGIDHGLQLDTYYDNLSKIPWHFFQNKEFSYPKLTQSYSLPFININKQKIAMLYKELGIEDLYKITRSCESTIINDRHCGSCWWCKERIWGFGYLD